MKYLKLILVAVVVFLTLYLLFRHFNKSTFKPNPKYSIGQRLDSMNGVYVYYNGMVGHTGARNVAADGYNIGMTYQCVEFVKRYYYERLGHKMPDSYGNAKDFFNDSLSDGSLNAQRALLQFRNGSRSKPKVEDLIIFDGHAGNSYGHVAIVCFVSDSNICIIQQNPGPFAASRDTFNLKENDGKWYVDYSRALGWLRKDSTLH